MTSIPAYSSNKVYRRLLSYVWPYRYAFVLALLGNVMYGAIDAGMMKLIQPLINKGFVERDQLFIRWVPFVIVGIFVLRGLATFLSTFFMGWVGRNVVMKFRQQMFHHLLKLPTSYYDRSTSGEILSKITYDVEQVANASSDVLTTLVRESFTVMFLVSVMLSISWRLTFFFIIVGPLMAKVMHVVSKRVRGVSGRIQQSMGNVTHVAEQAIEGQKVIKAFGGQAFESEHFERVTRQNRHQEMKLITTSALSIPMVQMVGAVALAATVYLALNSQHFLGTAIDPGGFATLMVSMVTLLRPIKELTKLNNNIQKGIAGAASIFAFLDEKPEVDNGTKTLRFPAGNVAFRNVSFNYGQSSNNILDNITFEAKAGETIAFVGRSGGGKSTLVNLLPRYYDAMGEIFIDGFNIMDLPLQALRQQIAIVTQHVTLFNSTVAHNIAYGCESSKEEIIQAAESAHAREFIERLPQGFDTMIGENGVRLSGGQRQRIAIARAILKKAPILILDEATSALDTESERYIQDALEKLMARCTTLVIAHRLSTIEKADRIIVVDKGKIIEMGSHEELIRLNGTYAALRVMQYQDPQLPLCATK